MGKELKIFTPLLYLKLENKSLSVHIWGFPLLLAVFICVIALLLSESVNVYGDDGLIRSINQLLSILVAFYIASLAAIATFKNDVLDSKFAGEPVKLTVKRSGKKETEEVTRRKFLRIASAVGLRQVLPEPLLVAGQETRLELNIYEKFLDEKSSGMIIFVTVS